MNGKFNGKLDFIDELSSNNELLPWEMINNVTAGLEEQKSKEDKKMRKTIVEGNLDELKSVLNKKQYIKVKDKLAPFKVTVDNADIFLKINGIGPKTVEKVIDYLNNRANSEEKDLEIKAKRLADELSEDLNKDVSRTENVKSNVKEFFDVNIDSKANIKGVKVKGHLGLEISDFKWIISTANNAATYNNCEVYKGKKDDNFAIWGKYTGNMDKAVNGGEEARFEFYLRGNNLSVSYWKGYKYQDKAKKMAIRAINVLQKALQ